MRILAIDIETFSSVDLTKSGVYAYTEAPDFEILLFGYAFDDEPVKVVDLAQGEKLPTEVMEALADLNVIKTAFNANFERICIARHFKIATPPEQWRCSMVHALTLGLPGHLEEVAKTLKLEQQKDSAGKALIRYFSMPCKPTKSNGMRTRNLPEHAPEKWKRFIEYCRQDVEVERAIRKALEKYPVLDKEWKLWQLDQKINDNGVMVDLELVRNAISCDTAYQEKLKEEAIRLTGLDNPKSVAQLKAWLEDTEGIEIESLSKETVPVLLEKTECETVKKVLEIRQEMAKTSVKKYQAIDRTVCSDRRVRGLFQFYGANRTGRWAGRLVQVQNLPRNSMPDINLARQLLKAGEYELLELLYESVSDVLSQLIRTAFIPSPGSRLIVSDFSAIEARVLSWLADEQWKIEVFQTHGKIYEATASRMFHVPIESITKDNPLRQKGKIAELALGYGGNVGALVSMGALKMGLSEEELPELVTSWRQANPNIVKFWWDVGNAAIKAVKEKTTVSLQHNIDFTYESGCLFIKLPSGRRLAYARPKIEIDEQTGKQILTYEGSQQGKRSWGRTSTYGPKLVENIVQAVSRDCLAEAMLRLDQAGYSIVMHVHDEVVLDAPNGFGSVQEVTEIMGRPIPWAPGLPLKAEGYETEYYMKD